MNISQMKSWGQQVEEEAIDRVYYEALDLQESSDRLRNANVCLMQENLSLREQLQEGRRVVGEYMGTDQSRTDQINHLAKQTVRLQKENEDLKRDYALLMETNKQCAQSNVDLHTEVSGLQYKLKCASADCATKLTAWVDANTGLRKTNADLERELAKYEKMVDHLAARNVDLEKTVKDLNCIAGGGFACGGCVSCLLDKAYKTMADLNRQLTKLQTSDAAHRKIIDLYNSAGQILTYIPSRSQRNMGT
jgi:DNA repair exonuclease SbcCD ATPase subunit